MLKPVNNVMAAKLSSMASSHIKADYLKALLSKEGESCDEKLEKIHSIVGLPYDKPQPNEEVGESDLPVTISAREASIAKIVEGLSGNELKLANHILHQIELSAILGWDYDSLEIKVKEELIPHSNIKLLIGKIVKLQSPLLPTSFALFIYYLLEIKCSQNVFRDADALEIRKNFILLKKNSTNTDVEPEIIEKSQSEGEVVDELNSVVPDDSPDTTEDQSDEVTENSTKITPEKKKKNRKRTFESAELAETANLADTVDFSDPPESIRRSKRLRLKNNIAENWIHNPS